LKYGLSSINVQLVCLHVHKRNAFLESRLFSANRTFLKVFQNALIGWIKAGPSKRPLYFWAWKQTIYDKQSSFSESRSLQFVTHIDLVTDNISSNTYIIFIFFELINIELDVFKSKSLTH